ncbi:hypothetical protein LFZ31_00630, partial [Salmonella enterica subsp. enterica serovar Newport str. S09097]
SLSLLPSDIADVTLEGEVQVVEQLGHETQIHIQIPAIRQNLVYRQNDVVLVEEGATFAIGLPPERCHLFREDGSACRRLHQESRVFKASIKKRNAKPFAVLEGGSV